MKKLSSESLPKTQEGDFLNTVYQLPGFPQNEERSASTDYNRDGLLKTAERFLNTQIQEGDPQARFLLGQLYFEEGWYKDALVQFEKVKENDYQALYQVGVMNYDGLGIEENPEKGVECMKRIVASNSPKAKHLKYAAAYNLGRAYYEGYGVPHSDTDAERWWLLAADNGNPKASIKAQSVLGMYYTKPPNQDLQKAFFWHSEACANGSLESQGALGVMYLNGLGVKKDLQSAMECLKEAAERGNAYAHGHLVSYYYHRKLYTTAAELAKKIIPYDNIELLAQATDCLPTFTAKGVAMATFYLARCLQLGLGIKQDTAAAMKYYAKACRLDINVAADLHLELIYGRI
ncbi:LRP2-binding protein [Spea bombifrons]|uniref:LRP2-binding protein n=1 Tax=Spea bombifrons TaxID=233779 RepID=UPI0023492435|nr:LRP2-binding protein [Spea bombifrons]